MSYETLATFYDLLSPDADYPRRAKKLLELFHRHNASPRLLLDAACGTGGFLLAFLQEGVDVIGVDLSENMLARARQRAAEAGFSPLLLRQRLRELDLYGTVDGAICTFDSLNHISTPRELAQSISRIALFLEPGCLFLFDVNTLYKHREVLGDNTFVYDLPEVYCVWRNAFHEASGRVDYALDLFVPAGNGYSRLTEEFSEYYYSDEMIQKALQSAGLELLEILDGDTFGECGATSQRKLYITEKQGLSE